MPSLSAVKLDGSLVEVDLSGAKSVAEVRGRIATSLAKPTSIVKLLVDDREISDEDQLSDLGATCTAVVKNAPMFEGKEVQKIAGSSVYGNGSRSVVFFTDGSTQRSDTYFAYDSLVKELAFVVYKSREHDRYYGGESFEALPADDPTEWEEVPPPHPMPLGFASSGWRRKEDGKFAGQHLNAT